MAHAGPPAARANNPPPTPNAHDASASALALMPPDVRSAIPTARWRRDRLWALRLPVEDVPTAEFAWLLDLPLWRDGGVPFCVSPDQVRSDPERYPGQHRRTWASDLAYPIHLADYNGRWTILDGVHRLLKATILGRTFVCAMKPTEADLRAITA